MIVLYSGTPGSGKSMHTADKIQRWLLSNRPVICNFEFRDDIVRKKAGKKPCGDFMYRDNESLTPELLVSASRWYFRTHKVKKREDQILLVIDEAQLVFNCREWNSNNRKSWMSFFTQHRKLGYYVILIAQFDRMLDRQIRSLFEYEYNHRKVSNYGIKGKFLSFWCWGNMYICVKIWYPLKEKVGSETFVGRPSLYVLYNTYKGFDDLDVAATTDRESCHYKKA